MKNVLFGTLVVLSTILSFLWFGLKKLKKQQLKIQQKLKLQL
jgi:hypothetical protein